MEINKKVLEQLYLIEKKSCRETGLVLCKSAAEVSRLLKKHQIPTRPCSTKGMPAWNRGKRMTPTTRENLSKARRGYKLSPEHKEKVKKTLVFGAKGEKNHNWKGGKHYSSNGYVLLRKPDHPDSLSNGYISEHRFVMEQKIGRRLKNTEHVHHINGVKDDNRPENLELLNGHTHNLITMLETKIKNLQEENSRLKKLTS